MTGGGAELDSQPRDVTATHVWGIRRDELDVGYVTGLRLIPGQETGSQ